MVELWRSILRAFAQVLTFLHDILVPVFGENSWGWAIVALTLIVRVLLLPLAIKQTRSMRAMQAIQPQMKALQKKYKVDRELMKKDPEQYKAKKAKLNEEMMALYKEEGANPAASCLPLLAQAPIFLVLFWTLRDFEELNGAPFYFVTRFVSAESEFTGLAALVNEAGWPGWLLIVLMSGTMFLSQKQMMARTAVTQGDANPMAQQQKILLYVMPLFLAVISFQFPLGILLYWVTTNAWQVVQQWIILREVTAEKAAGTLPGKSGDATTDDADPKEAPRRSPGASSGTKPVEKGPDPNQPDKKKPNKSSGGADKGSNAGKKKGPSSGNGKQSPTQPSKGKASSTDASGKAGSPDDPSGRPTKNTRPPTNGSSSGGRGSSSNGTGAGRSGADKPRAGKRDHLPRRPRR
jgi:YidC/Oxa1 family membrane protein insertase